MTDRPIDRIARGFAGAASRRSVFRGIAPGVLAAGLNRVADEQAAARCRRAGESCGRKRRCCPGASCEDHVCACAAEITEPCNGRCCADCFGAEPEVFCCPVAKVCPSESGDPGEDVCCYPDEVRLDHTCCCDGCLGAKVCGKECCPSASCCDGKCCGSDQVCARERRNAPLQCVSAVRPCDGDDECLFEERCVGGTCCSGSRICARLDPAHPDGPVCCPYGRYCDKSGDASRDQCCPVGERCATVRLPRFRRV
jgi:hypothetical protein